MNRALITQVGNESELAGVLGHEVGHIVGRHGAKQISKQYGLTFITEMILGGGDSSNSLQIAAQFAGVGGVLGMLHYSRKAEREADLLAVQVMYDTGIDPKGLTTFFEKVLYLHEEAGGEPEGFQVFLSTHPNTRERIENVHRMIAELAPKAGLQKDSDQFQHVKDRLLAITTRKTGG